MSCKFKHVGVWDILFYLTDDDGHVLLNEDGTEKIFTLNAKTLRGTDNVSFIGEYFTPENLEAVSVKQGLPEGYDND